MGENNRICPFLAAAWGARASGPALNKNKSFWVKSFGQALLQGARSLGKQMMGLSTASSSRIQGGSQHVGSCGIIFATCDEDLNVVCVENVSIVTKHSKGLSWEVLVNPFNPSTQDGATGKSLSQSVSTEKVLGQPGLQRKLPF